MHSSAKRAITGITAGTRTETAEKIALQTDSPLFPLPPFCPLFTDPMFRWIACSESLLLSVSLSSFPLNRFAYEHDNLYDNETSGDGGRKRVVSD